MIGLLLLLSYIPYSLYAQLPLPRWMAPKTLEEEIRVQFIRRVILYSFVPFLLRIFLPFSLMFLVCLKVPLTLRKKYLIYALLIPSLAAYPVGTGINHVVAKYVFQGLGEMGMTFDLGGVLALITLMLYGVHLFFVGFTADVLALWKRGYVA
jgi:hypothetical protein